MARTAESIVRTAAYPWGQHVSCADDPEALEAVALGWLEPGEPSPLNPGVRVFHVTAAGLAMAAESGALVSWCGNHTDAHDKRPRVGKKAASATPEEFREVLIGMARSVTMRREV